MLEYRILECGKTTTYHGMGKVWPLGKPDAVAILADDDVIDVFILDSPTETDGIEAYIADTPCTKLLGVFIPWIDEPLTESDLETIMPQLLAKLKS